MPESRRSGAGPLQASPQPARPIESITFRDSGCREQATPAPEPGILTGMTSTTIKVPKRTRDRLHRLAQAEGLTLAQAIDKLIDEAAPRPRPSIGGFRSGQPLDAEAIDA